MYGEDFEYYFDNFTEDNTHNEEARSFQKVKAALLEKFSTKMTDAKVMEEAVNLVYKGVMSRNSFGKLVSRVRKPSSIVKRSLD